MFTQLWEKGEPVAYALHLHRYDPAKGNAKHSGGWSYCLWNTDSLQP